ncbi:MAG: DUF1957 domain-containing protein [Treponema sp.]|jgi:1,4-alpha-glucan branching enzyme|nr:DUF1957 domain-containing protein [Treponema sp.]
MEKRSVISIVLKAHLPFIPRDEGRRASREELRFFETLSETYLPLLEVLGRLDADNVPFRLGVSLSPSFCHLLSDENLLKKYLDYTDKQIEFGRQEEERTRGQEDLHALVRFYSNLVMDRRISFTERYEGNILKSLDYFQKKGKVEILATAATNAFLPFFCTIPETVQAQLEAGLASYRGNFGRQPQGFWLPELGWTAALDGHLRSYNFGYTIVESHGLVFGNPPAEKGTFYPVKTPAGIFIFARDYRAGEEYRAAWSPFYRDNDRDAGYDLPAGVLGPFISADGGRSRTGYKYYRISGGKGEKLLYDPAAAGRQAADEARRFLDGSAARLASAALLMDEQTAGLRPVSLCVFDADDFGRFWYEGPAFIETLFREGARRDDLQFMNPAEYLYRQKSGFQILTPEFSSAGINGYAQTWLDASNDWIYRHLFRASDRMVEMAERFSDDSGLRERALNQAARELLLAEASDWPRMMYGEGNSGIVPVNSESGFPPGFARNRMEEHLRNFTTIYEALGSNYISTEWLTGLEKKHNIFPEINYRIFRRKK